MPAPKDLRFSEHTPSRDTALTVRELVGHLQQHDQEARVAVSVHGKNLQLVDLVAVPDSRRLVILLHGMLPV